MKIEEIDILSYHKGKIEYKPKKETVKLYKALKTHATYRDWETDRKSTRLNSSHSGESRMPSSA